MPEKLKFILPVLLAITLSITSCNEKETMREQTIRADSVSLITTKTARIYSTLIFLNGAQHDLRISNGVVYSLSPNPTINDLVKPAQGLAKGQFWSDLTNLLNDTTYYVRTYITTKESTIYSQQISFRTKAFEDPDLNFYSSVRIGKQKWLKENLNTSKYQDGSPIGTTALNYEWHNANTGLYYNDPRTANLGRLYNLFAIQNSKKLCPSGTHIPSESEWQTLIDTLGGAQIATQKLKATSGWPNSTGGSNSSGFSAFPAGYFESYNQNGSLFSNYFRDFYGANFWVGSQNTGFSGKLIKDEINSYLLSPNVSSGLSVRCIVD